MFCEAEAQTIISYLVPRDVGIREILTGTEYDKPGARPTNDIPIEFEIRPKFGVR